MSDPTDRTAVRMLMIVTGLMGLGFVGFLVSALVVALFAPEGRHVQSDSPADVASNARTELLDGFRARRADSPATAVQRLAAGIGAGVVHSARASARRGRG